MTELLIFLHIPKCGGVSFHRILEKNFAASEIFSVDGRDPWTSMELLFQQPHSILATIRLIKGHVLYGIHESMPHQQFKYITFIRDPITRLNSLFRYARSQVSHPLHHLAHHSTFEEFSLNSEVPDNFQTKLIAGVKRENLLQPCSAEIYHRAMANIERDFLFVGTLEQFEESLMWLRTQNILRNIFYERRNVTPRSVAHQLPCEDPSNAVIGERHHWDYSMYTQVS